MRNPAGWIKCLGIGQVIYQLHKIRGYFVSPLSAFLLHPFPAVFIFLYEQAFTQNRDFLKL
jgi:hypothetical protein